MEGKWRKIDGYEEEHQFIDAATERIAAWACGSKHHAHDGWSARIEMPPAETMRLGTFATVDAAKRAAELKIAKKEQADGR